MSKTDFNLVVGDCVEGMKALPEASVDLVVTSPPYNLGIQYRQYRDNRSKEDYLTWSLAWTAQVKRVLRPEGSFFLNLGASPSDPLLPHELVVKLRDQFCLQNTFHWIKSITVETRAGAQVSAGHFKPINSKRYVNDCHEYVFHLTKKGNTPVDRLGLGVPYSDKSNIARWGHTNGRDLRCRGNNWFIPYKTILSREKDRPHPATFPVQLAVNCIRIHGFRSDLVVLDPFLGIGHSAVAAQQCGISKFIGFEIDEHYVQEARAALKESLKESEGTKPERAVKVRTPRRRGEGETNQQSLFNDDRA